MVTTSSTFAAVTTTRVVTHRAICWCVNVATVPSMLSAWDFKVLCLATGFVTRATKCRKMTATLRASLDAVVCDVAVVRSTCIAIGRSPARLQGVGRSSGQHTRREKEPCQSRTTHPDSCNSPVTRVAFAVAVEPPHTATRRGSQRNSNAAWGALCAPMPAVTFGWLRCVRRWFQSCTNGARTPFLYFCVCTETSC